MSKRMKIICLSLAICSLAIILFMQFQSNKTSQLPEDFQEFITNEAPMPKNASDEEILKWIETTTEYLEEISGQKVVSVTEDDEKITFYFEIAQSNSKWRMETAMYFK